MLVSRSKPTSETLAKKKNQKLNLFEQLLFTQVQKDLRETFHDETIRLPDILTSLKAIFCFTENASMS